MGTPEKLSRNAKKYGVMVNEQYEPTDREDAILDVFHRHVEEFDEGRLNPYIIRDETDLEKGDVNTALSNLRAAGWVRRVTHGLYEFVHDPRRATDEPETAERPTKDPNSEPETTTDPVSDALAGWRHGRGEAERAASREIAEQATEWLRQSPLDTASKSDVPLDELADADPEGRSTDTLWTQVVREAWKHAIDRGYMDQPNSRAYRWVGGEGDEGDAVYDPTDEF